MKLTKIHRQAFVRAVMQDVPTVNFDDQIHKFVKERAIEYLPPQLRPVALDKDLSGFLSMDTMWFEQHRTGVGAVRVFAARSGGFRLNDKDQAHISKLMNEAERQIEDRKSLQERIEGVIASCITLRQATERLPEFVKYLPAEQEKTNNLPAIANIVADLAKRGWPKSATPAAA